jgi:hypothetical protein
MGAAPMGLNEAVIAATDLVVVGFSAPHSVRAAMVQWFNGSKRTQSALPQHSGCRLAVLRMGEVPGGRRSYLV